MPQQPTEPRGPPSGGPLFLAVNRMLRRKLTNWYHIVLAASACHSIAQKIAADRPEPGTAFSRLPLDAVAH